ncbi:trypsin-like serine peptidase [Aliamphritea hakodatensis]|uniref:trypsin-like serine peptidase n=1 Tax=Aliamphritea hakodatensis TaxID=2895352 RepID=UPI0022FD383A|nr:trypsin-like serine protease [Aliamphritea hakodatensis]
MVHNVESGGGGKGVSCIIRAAVLVVWFYIAGVYGGPVSGPAVSSDQQYIYSPRVVVSGDVFPWRAIGRINLAGRGYCTATLIARDVVLTAAHCLWNRDMGRWYPLQYLKFVVGMNGKNVQAVAGIKRMLVSRAFSAAVSQAAKPWLDVRSDWALLRLDKPLGDMLGSVSLATGMRPSVGMPVVHAGYRYDRQEVLTVQQRCVITGIYDRQRLLRSNCQSGYGDSGGPLLFRQEGRWYVLGLHSVRVGDSASLAVAARVYSEFWSGF